ncbi:Crp/Fnr family transcriptional regulator [Candidatus Neomarinimicrobiota bacterium]
MKSAIWDNIFKNKQDGHTEVTLAMSQVPVFQGLSERALREIEHIVHHREFHEGEVIFNEGDPGLGMYIILNGKVQILNNQDPENPIIYSELGEGDFFGDLALVDDADRSASAISAADTHLIAFFRPELKDILERFPKMGNKILLNLAQVTAQRLRKTNELLMAAQASPQDESA